MYDIIGIGGLVYDFVKEVETMPSVGETVMAKTLRFNLGGKSSNAIVQASLLGNLSTAFIGKVGADQYGREQLENLKSYGVNIDNVKIDENALTSMAFVTVDDRARNQIVLVAGAGNLLTVPDIDQCFKSLSNCRVLICSFEIPIDACAKAISIALESCATTILIPAPLPVGFTSESLPKVDIICPNEVEAGQLLGMSIDSIESAKEAINRFFELGKVRWPIITLGDKGAVVGIKPGLIKVVPAPKVNCVDTTGAGDSFVGSLAFYLIKNPESPIDNIVSNAVLVASLSTTKKGTRLSYCSSQDLL